jgi:hypothetical protein
LLVVGCGQLDLRRIVTCSDLAEEAQGISLVSAFLVLSGVIEGTLSECNRVLLAVSQEIRFAQPGDPE